MPQPSLRSLARQLGLSAATVSLALRDSPRVIPDTKRRVRQAARRAGYRANALVRSVMAAVRRSAHDSFQGALVAVNYSDTDRADLSHYHRALFAGATRAKMSKVGTAAKPFALSHARGVWPAGTAGLKR